MLYHFDHRTITASKSGSVPKAIQAAAASLRYIQRQGTVLYHENTDIRALLSTKEFTRKNARVCDKIIVALPREATPLERRHLVKNFLDGLGAWQNVATAVAFHDSGRDAGNPHAHLMIIDRPLRPGGSRVGLTDFKSTERLRFAWEQTLNSFARARGLDTVSSEKRSRRTRQEQNLYQEAKRLRAALSHKNREYLTLRGLMASQLPLPRSTTPATLARASER